jgi:molybdate transport system substrate-binding protein
MITRRLFGLAMAAAIVALDPSAARAAETQVAVAANFTEPAREIAQAFKAATGNTASLSFGSSGQFYAQMSHGAPYEVFLSADADRPAAAEREGRGVGGARFTYAIGRLVLYSTTPGLADGGAAVLKGGKFNKLSIADPAAAPYGTAAVQTLTRLGVYTALKPKIVQGASITQAYQFVDTGAAELGFVALSQVINVPGGSLDRARRRPRADRPAGDPAEPGSGQRRGQGFPRLPEGAAGGGDHQEVRLRGSLDSTREDVKWPRSSGRR